MNKFATRGMDTLIDRLRSEVAGLAESDETSPETGLIGVLTDAADTLEAARSYWASVESALV